MGNAMWFRTLLMNNKQDYIASLQQAIKALHGCDAVYLRTDHIHETFQGKTVWDGDVEVFTVVGHPKAKHAYAWAHLDGPKDDKTRFVAVLELPPVTDATTAVRASIMADGNKQSRTI